MEEAANTAGPSQPSKAAKTKPSSARNTKRPSVVIPDDDMSEEDDSGDEYVADSAGGKISKVRSIVSF